MDEQKTKCVCGGEINKRMYNLYYVVFESLVYVFGFNDVASYPWLTAGILSFMAAGSVCVERPTVGGGFYRLTHWVKIKMSKLPVKKRKNVFTQCIPTFNLATICSYLKSCE